MANCSDQGDYCYWQRLALKHGGFQALTPRELYLEVNRSLLLQANNSQDSLALDILIS